MKHLSALILWLVMVMGPVPLSAAMPAERSVDAFIAQLKAQARQEGISESLLSEVFAGFTINKKAVKADKEQPEDKLKFTRYRKNIVSPARISRGRQMYAKHRALLEQVARDYQVPAKYIVALWGTETSYGSFTGGHNVPRALASLAYEGRREAFFTKEFILSLKIIEAGHTTLNQMKGSWAGAMGQCQFMPSSFLNYAVDYDGDGDKDIWNSLPDVFASIANYLKQHGWKGDERWGRKVALPAGFDLEQEDINGFYPLHHWQTQGVRTISGAALPDADIEAAFMMPGVIEEGAYLVYPNYHVFLKWNFSRYFATAVGLLADKIAAGAS